MMLFHLFLFIIALEYLRKMVNLDVEKGEMELYVMRGSKVESHIGLRTILYFFARQTENY